VQQPPSTEKTGPQKGDVIDGKLEIEGIIAEGRTSTVVSAIDRGNNYRKVAIKIARASDLESVERFKRGARGMQKLKSPYAVKVLGVGTTQEGAPCMTMEYLEGRTLAQKLMQSGPLPIEEARKWMLQVCAVVAEAHSQKLLHRDLDAENLFLAMPPRGVSGPPSMRVLDFGLAPVWRLGKGDGRLRPGDVPGTSFAMAPELARGSDVDERVDVWGIGACLFRLLTNKHPYNARNLAELCTRILAERPPDLAKVRADVTPGLAAVVKRCLEREPGDRFRSVHDVLHALEESGDDAPYTPQVPTEKATLDQLRAIEDQRMTPMVFRAADAEAEGERITIPSSDGDDFDAATQIHTKEELANQVRSLVARPIMDASGEVGATPQTMRIGPEFDAIANRLEPPKPKRSDPPPKKRVSGSLPAPSVPPPRSSGDGPSTQPLGRLSPFAELPKAAPPPSTPPSDDHTIKPVLIGAGPLPAAPLPKPSPERMNAETAPPPPLLPNTAPPPRMPTTAPPPLPMPSPAVMAAETMQGPAPHVPAPPLAAQPSPAEMDDETVTRMEMPAPLPVFQASPRVLEIPTLTPSAGIPAMVPPTTSSAAIPVMPPPTPRPSGPYLPSGPPPPLMTGPPPMAPPVEPPREATGSRSKLLIPLIFALGIAASIVIGLYVARLTTPKPAPKPSAEPSAGVVAPPPASDSAEPDDSDPTPDTSAESPALEIPSSSAPAAATHRRHHRRPTPASPSPAPAPAPAPAKTGNVYDPSMYDPH
jgi:serine/threonine protein kinase